MAMRSSRKARRSAPISPTRSRKPISRRRGERAAYYRWMFFGAGPVEAATTNKALGVEPPEGKTVMVGYGRFSDVLDTLEFAVSRGEYLAGNRFSAADVYLGSQIGAGMMFGVIEKRLYPWHDGEDAEHRQ